ncbi:uncharacterized protein N7484_001324 [Penicillium longicatenatum]|uniref:uncharacterized protein n=1 Tax=Penicillium longicatenatum TaxID=1561947 RepID=UPI002546BCF4|nr:uncharacterized protein N7484_001324 [Penicillium longicatenatum]KAJ5657675.1 hypothetical protein N7484_001324 [Penicillium longicatenatum]
MAQTLVLTGGPETSSTIPAILADLRVLVSNFTQAGLYEVGSDGYFAQVEILYMQNSKARMHLDSNF